MACCTDGYPLGDMVLDTEEPAYEGCRDGARDSRDRDGDDGHRGDAADLCGNHGTHGDGDGLGQQGEHERAAQPEQLAEEYDAGDRGEAPYGDARQDGLPVALQLGNLLVERDRENDGGGGEEERDVVSADVVAFEAYSGREQEPHDEHVRDEDGVQDGVLPLLAHEDAYFEGDEREEDTEQGGVDEGSHFLRRSCRRIRNCVEMPVMAIVTTVKAMHMVSSRGQRLKMSSPTAMMAMLGGRKNRGRCFRKTLDTVAMCSSFTTFRHRRMSSRTMPMMFPGRGMPTMRFRNSPARQMAKMMASCKGILISGFKSRNYFFLFPLNGKCKVF